MNKASISRMYIDHHLQAALLSRLSEADGPLRFSELKEDGVENSLFMYHANKLIARKAIIKDEDGFHLTANGARWVNSIGRDMKNIQPTVKPLIQLVVCDTENNILLSTRRGQLKKLLNDFMLPGGLHKNGMSADENALYVINKIIGTPTAVPEFLSSVESINVYDDGFIYHSIAHIYKINVVALHTPIDDERFSFEWMPIKNVRVDNPLFASSLFVPKFVGKLQNNVLQPREVIRINYTK